MGGKRGAQYLGEAVSIIFVDIEVCRSSQTKSTFISAPGVALNSADIHATVEREMHTLSIIYVVDRYTPTCNNIKIRKGKMTREELREVK